MESWRENRKEKKQLLKKTRKRNIGVEKKGGMKKVVALLSWHHCTFYICIYIAEETLVVRAAMHQRVNEQTLIFSGSSEPTLLVPPLFPPISLFPSLSLSLFFSSSFSFAGSETGNAHHHPVHSMLFNTTLFSAVAALAQWFTSLISLHPRYIYMLT